MIKLSNIDKITPDSSNPHQFQSNTHIQPTTEHIINNVIPTISKPILAMYHHQTLGSPPVPTIVKKCRNNQLNTFHTKETNGQTATNAKMYSTLKK